MLVEFDQVGMRYGPEQEILSDLTFSLERGSFHYLTGSSGAGKTSLLRLIYLAHKPTRGHIRMFSTEMTGVGRNDLTFFRRRIGVVFQDFRLITHLSVFDNVALPLRILDQDEALIRRNVSELLEWVGLTDHRDVAPLTLSGGQQQRVAIARAVVTNPELLLADEPTGNVDDETAHRLLFLFEQMNRNGTTVFIATHNRDLLHYYPHPVLHLANKTVQLGEDEADALEV